MTDKKSNSRNNNNRRKNSGDEDYNPKFRKMRKKVCVMCANKDFVLDYKNADQLKKFVNEKGKILPRRATGACAKHQRDITLAVKRARTIAILPFTQN
jgi:small subunit ribosomal protein S18